MPHVTFVHGLANKPPQDALLETWLGALKGRFGGGLDLAGAGVTSEMVYWADVLYPKPAAIDEEESDDTSTNRAVPELMPPVASLSAEEQRFVRALEQRLDASLLEVTAEAAENRTPTAAIAPSRYPASSSASS